jgi:2-methylcitrate dehydratase PrpD
VFGAAGGAAKVLGLDAGQITYALGLAGSQAAGLLEWKAQGSWSKVYQAGHPSMSGTLGALLAMRNYSRRPACGTARTGFIRALSYKDIWDYSKIIDESENAGNGRHLHQGSRLLPFLGSSGRLCP